MIDIKKLDLHDSDVLVLKSGWKTEAMLSLRKAINNIGYKNVLIIGESPGLKIEKMDEKTMNKYGWFRKDSL